MRHPIPVALLRKTGLTLEEFLAKYPPIAGAQDPPEGDPADPAKPPEADPVKAETDPVTTADPAKEGDPKPDPDTVQVTKAEYDALRRRVAESEKQKRESDRKAREQEDERQREQGEFQKLAETKAREAEDLRKRLEGLERSQRVSRIAARLHFRDPEDVTGWLKPEEADDEILAEAALERIAAEKPYLLDKPGQAKPEIGQVLAPSAAPDGHPAATGIPKTADDYAAMSQEELAALPDEEFQKALRLLKTAGKL